MPRPSLAAPGLPLLLLFAAPFRAGPFTIRIDY